MLHIWIFFVPLRPKLELITKSIYKLMKLKHFYAILTVLLGGLLAGCHSDINFDNIDPKAELNMGVALPVGSIHFTIGDFFGTGFGNFYIDSIGDNKDVITWKDTFVIAKNFHQVDLAQYISKKQMTLNFYDEIKKQYPLIPEGMVIPVTGNGIPVEIPFEIPLKLTGINDPATVSSERLDRARIEMASFSSVLKTINMSDFKWEWLDNVRMYLGTQIHRDENDTVVIYDKNRDSFGGFNEEIPTNVDNFTINLLKDGITGQVVDSCNFKIFVTFTIPTGETMMVNQNSGFDYALGVRFIDYTAIWGKFARSTDMYDENVVDLSGSWEGVDFISKSKVPFADPRIQMNIVTKVAGAMKINGDYLYSIDTEGVKHEASFKRGNQTYKNFPHQFEDGEFLDPQTSAIGDSTTNMILKFDKSPENGHIDELFKNMPQQLGYKFGVDFNYEYQRPDNTRIDQIRITPNTSVRIEAICTLPMDFGQGVFLEYSDTIRDLDLSQIRIDSLLGTAAKLNESEIHAILKAENDIPLDVNMYLRCLDEKGNIIMDPIDSTMPFIFFEQDTLRLKAPTYAKNADGKWVPQASGETTILASLNTQQLNLIPQVKKIVYSFTIDDKSMKEAYDNGMTDVRLTSKQGLTLSVGLTAQIDAILDFSNINR